VKGRTGALCALASLLSLLFTAKLPAQTGGWRADERILITDFGIATALARSPGTLFAATSGGLVTLDEAFESAEPPITVEDGYPAFPPTALAFDRRDGSLWIAASRELFQFDPFSRRFRDRLPVRQAVTDIVPADAVGSDLYIRMGGEWWRLDAFSRDLRRADPGAVRAAIAALPDLRARAEAISDPFFLDGARQAARSYGSGPVRVLDVMPARSNGSWWLATAGESLVLYEQVSRMGRKTMFGPVGAGMATVLATGDRVWMAPDRALEGRYGVGRATAELQQWSVWRADSSRSVPDAVRAFSTAPGGLWAAARSGVYWMPGDGEEWQAERAVGLARLPALCLATASGPGPRSVWVGTGQGLLRVMGPGGGVDVEVLGGRAVTSVVEADGQVWIGTPIGLFTMPVPDSTGAAAPRRAAGPSVLRDPVGALVASGDTVFAGVGREVWRKPGSGGTWTRLESIGKARAAVSALAVHGTALWVGTAAGVTVVETTGGRLETYSFGPDLPPGPRGETAVNAISVPSSQEAWLALPAGALRLQVRH
jgi:hypothetical protein